MKKLIVIIVLLFFTVGLSAQTYEFKSDTYRAYEFFVATDSLNGADTVTVTFPGPMTADWLVGIQTYVDTIGGHTSIAYTMSQANSYNADHYTVIKTWNTTSNIDTVFTLETPAFTGNFLRIQAINATSADSVIVRGWATLRKQ